VIDPNEVLLATSGRTSVPGAALAAAVAVTGRLQRFGHFLREQLEQAIAEQRGHRAHVEWRQALPRDISCDAAVGEST
jgi:hypothetical protein